MPGIAFRAYKFAKTVIISAYGSIDGNHASIMTIVVFTATRGRPRGTHEPNRTDLGLEKVTEESGENSRTKLHNVGAHRPVAHSDCLKADDASDRVFAMDRDKESEPVTTISVIND